jgi:acyl carrier protein
MTKRRKKTKGGLLGRLFGAAQQPAGPVTAEGVQTWLVNRLAEHLELPPEAIDVNVPFADYGLDSRTAVGMAGELEKLLGKELPHTLIWDFPTIAAVTRYAASDGTAAGNGDVPALEVGQ